MTANSIALLKVTLEDVRPAVQRRLAVPITIRLDRLHLVQHGPVTCKSNLPLTC